MNKTFSDLLDLLSKDPTLREAIDQYKAGGHSTQTLQAQSMIEGLGHIAQVAAKFMNKKKTDMITHYVEIVGLVLTLSVFLKVNLLDRPEVQSFLKHRFEEVQGVAARIQDYTSKAIHNLIIKIYKNAA